MSQQGNTIISLFFQYPVKIVVYEQMGTVGLQHSDSIHLCKQQQKLNYPHFGNANKF